MRAFAVFVLLAATPGYQYFVTGNKRDVQTKPMAAFALIGGGEDVDEVNRWLISKAAGGDLLVLRARGTDAYNPYFFGLGGLNSAQTAVVPTVAAAQDQFVVGQIQRAEAIFIAGGDQWNYMRMWKQAAVGEALREAVERGVPVGGTSAGLAVMGEYVFTAEKDTVTSAQALRNPFDKRVRLGKDFLQIAPLKNTITDSHFKARDRMGRTLVFLARMMQDFHLPEARAMAIDERTAALMDADGKLRVAGEGHIYFVRARTAPSVCRARAPLSISGVEVYRAEAGDHFDAVSWTGTGGKAYRLSVSVGAISPADPY
jgi:cyanophycinase